MRRQPCKDQVETIIAARCLERAADEAVDLAESVIFMVRGVGYKHHCHAIKEGEYLKEGDIPSFQLFTRVSWRSR